MTVQAVLILANGICPRANGEIEAQSERGVLKMRAHRVRVRISDNHELHVKLPSDFPPGEAEVIVLEAGHERSVAAARKLTVDELIAAKLRPSQNVGMVSLTDMERAIEAGATGRGGV